MSADILADLRKVQRLNGDTYSSAEVMGMVGRAADEIDRLHAALREIAGTCDFDEMELEFVLSRGAKIALGALGATPS
jgi:hypothetical protein